MIAGPNSLNEGTANGRIFLGDYNVFCTIATTGDVCLYNNKQRVIWRGNVKIPANRSSLGRDCSNVSGMAKWLEADFGSIKALSDLYWNSSGSNSDGTTLNAPFPKEFGPDLWEQNTLYYFGLESFPSTLYTQNLIATANRNLEESINHESDNTYDYWAFAPPGSSTSNAVWKVFRLHKTNIVKQYANGNANYTNVGTGLSALTYS